MWKIPGATFECFSLSAAIARKCGTKSNRQTPAPATKANAIHARGPSLRAAVPGREVEAGTGLRGFTLIELLVTVAVIALVAAVGIPALSRGKMSAQRARCASQVRQMGLAAQMYWEDNSGHSFSYQLGAANGGQRYWFGWIQSGSEGSREFDSSQGVLFPYYRGSQVAFCPSFLMIPSRFKMKAMIPTSSYGYNLHLAPEPPSQPRRIDDLTQPSRVVLFADAAQINTFQYPATPANPMLEEFYFVNANETTAHFRHRKTAAAVHVDGHVDHATWERNSIDPRMPDASVGKLRAETLIP